MSSVATRSYVPGLDGVRAISVSLVLGSHLSNSAFPDPVNRVLEFGTLLGVDVFFVLSGFLITRILTSERAAGGGLAPFYIRRFLRLMPAYWLLLLVVSVRWPDWRNLWCLFYAQNLLPDWSWLPRPVHHTWSLATEEQFYLLWPALLRFAGESRAKSLVLFGVVPGAIGGAVVALAVIPDPAVALHLLYVAMPFRVLSLAFGALMAFNEGFVRGPRALTLWALALLGASASVAGIVLAPFWLWPVFGLVGCSLFSSAAMLTALGSSFAFLRPALELPLPRYIGSISYGLYLYHYPIYHQLGVLTGDRSPWYGVVAVAASFAVAMASFHLFEQPLLRRFRPVGASAHETRGGVSRPPTVRARRRAPRSGRRSLRSRSCSRFPAAGAGGAGRPGLPADHRRRTRSSTAR